MSEWLLVITLWVYSYPSGVGGASVHVERFDTRNSCVVAKVAIEKQLRKTGIVNGYHFKDAFIVDCVFVGEASND